MMRSKLTGWRRLVEPPAFADTPLAAGLAAAASLAAGVAAVYLPPFVTSGANMADPAQADYARNLWSSLALERAVVAALCPLVLYAVLSPFFIGARKALLPISIAAVCVAAGLTISGLNAYRQPPQAVTGRVTFFQGREISQCGFGSHHLLVSDAELAQAHSWVKPGMSVLLYLTPSGDAAYIGRTQEAGLCTTSGLGM